MEQKSILPHIDISRALEGWGRLWGIQGLPGKACIRVEMRMTRGLGKCRPSTGLITLNPALTSHENSELTMEVLCHEAAHLAAYILHGKGHRPHGKEWKALVSAAGFAPRVRIPGEEVAHLAKSRRRARFEYLHLCLDCRSVYRALRTDRRWRCKSCSSSGKEGRFSVKRKKLGW